MCACCYRDGRGTWILSPGGCPGPRSLHCCLLYLGDWNSGRYWERLGHVRLFLVSRGVMFKNMLVSHKTCIFLASYKLLAFCIDRQLWLILLNKLLVIPLQALIKQYCFNCLKNDCERAYFDHLISPTTLITIRVGLLSTDVITDKITYRKKHI